MTKLLDKIDKKYFFLIIEDLEGTANTVEQLLKKRFIGSTTKVFGSGMQALEWLATTDKLPDLVYIDRQLEDIMGDEIVSRLNKDPERYRNMKKIIVTAYPTPASEVRGFENGCDDYIIKPIVNDSFVSRIKKILESINEAPVVKTNGTECMVFGDFVIDKPKIVARYKDKNCGLTATEFNVLYFLAQNKQVVFSRDTLLSKVWSYDYSGDSRTVDVTIARTRKKISDAAEGIDASACIVTRRGSGYCFDPTVFIAKKD